MGRGGGMFTGILKGQSLNDDTRSTSTRVIVLVFTLEFVGGWSGEVRFILNHNDFFRYLLIFQNYKNYIEKLE